MEDTVIYLNHAATTYPKPAEVQEAVRQAIENLPLSQYRSTAQQTDGRDDIRGLCRESLARLFHIREPERIFFTNGSTQALNLAILGFRSRRSGIVMTAAEHNAVLRTVYDGLRDRAAVPQVTVIPCDAGGYADLEQMERAITEDTGLVIVNHCSNVTGAVQDIETIGQMAARKEACFLVDASQSAGTLPVDVEEMQIDMLAFTGHKGLFGIQGCGGLYVRKGIELRPLCFGGTGTDSRVMIPKEPFYEVGTANIPGIAALYAGSEYVQKIGLERIMQKERPLMGMLYGGLKECDGVHVFADRQPEGTALSFLVDGISAEDTGYILAGSYRILVRTGLHCAPLVHRYLGTQQGGTVRVSISWQTKEEEITAFLHAVRQLSEAVRGQ